MADPEYSLSWDTFKTNICDGFTNLQQQGEFVDMTLAADGHYVKVHRSLIALASPYLKEIITSIPCQHPVVFLNNINYDELCYTLEYIYTGEVQIPTQKLGQFLKIAKSLHIKGIQDTENNELETSASGHTAQHASVTLEQSTGQDKLPRLVVKRLPLQKGTSMSLPPQEKTPRPQVAPRGRGRPFKVSRADRINGKKANSAVKQLRTDTTENNVVPQVPQPIESVSTSPGLSEFLTINKAQNEANQKDDRVSLSDFFITDDKEPVQENNVQSFLTDTFPMTTDDQGVNSNVDMENAQPMALDILANDFFLKDTNAEANLPNQSNEELFPGKSIDFGTGNGENVFKIKILSQEVVSRAKTDIFNDHINRENYENEFEMQEKTCSESIQPCPTSQNFEDIIDQHTNIRTSQPAAQFNITLTDGQNVSIQSVNTVCTDEPPAISTAMDYSSSQNDNSYHDPPTNLNDNDIKDSCCPLYTVSNQGSLQLILNRHIYACHHKSRKDQLLRRWRCVSYRPRGCKAVIDTDGELILRRVGTHNHSYHDNKIIEKTRQGKVFSTIAATNVEAAKIRNGSAVAVIDF